MENRRTLEKVHGKELSFVALGKDLDIQNESKKAFQVEITLKKKGTCLESSGMLGDHTHSEVQRGKEKNRSETCQDNLWQAFKPRSLNFGLGHGESVFDLTYRAFFPIVDINPQPQEYL